METIVFFNIFFSIKNGYHGRNNKKMIIYDGVLQTFPSRVVAVGVILYLSLSLFLLETSF